MPYAVVTGGTQGMGRAIAEKLLSQGFSVAICARNAEKLAAIKNEWAERFPGCSVFTHSADLENKNEVAAFGEAILATFPQVDVVVNNAGTFSASTIAEEPDGLLEKMLALNLYAAYGLTRKILPAMKAARAGHIFNICSIASLHAIPNGGAYAISKFALMGFSQNLREELKEYNIKVTAVCPGATLTSSWDGQRVENNRILEAGDIAEMLLSAYKLSPQANVETIIIRPVKGDL